jgi:hypothetical protein
MLRITAVWTFHLLKSVHFANNQHCRGEKWVQRQGDFKDCIGRQKSPQARYILRITLSGGKFWKVLNKHTLQDFFNSCTIPRPSWYVQKLETTPTLKQKTNLGPSEFPDCGFDFSSSGSLFCKTLNVVADLTNLHGTLQQVSHKSALWFFENMGLESPYFMVAGFATLPFTVDTSLACKCKFVQTVELAYHYILHLNFCNSAHQFGESCVFFCHTL